MSAETGRFQSLPRSFVILALVTVLAVAAAMLAVWLDRRAVTVSQSAGLLFPELAENLADIDVIRVTAPLGMGGTAETTIERGENDQWVVTQLSDYPAKQEAVRALLLGLSELEATEPRTADPEWHQALGLTAPEDLGKATRISFENADGEAEASILVGSVPEQSMQAGAAQGLIYVRRDGEDQTWLAKGRLPIYQKASEWLDPTLLALTAADVRRTVLWAGSETPVILERETPDAPFTLVNLPDGDAARGEAVLKSAATVLATSGFETVVPADQITFDPNLPMIVIDTFNGLKIVTRLASAGNQIWARFEVEVDPWPGASAEDIAKAEDKAASLRNRLSSWAYQLPSDVAAESTLTRDQLVRSTAPGARAPASQGPNAPGTGPGPRTRGSSAAPFAAPGQRR